MERLLSELTEKLKRAHGDRLVSVVLYGSGAEPAQRDARSDYNVLCVLTSVTVDTLRASEPVFRWWREMKNPAPLLLSLDELHTSTDCFPIEFHDIRERHRILFGQDLVSELEIDDSFYRAQVEHELRAKLLRLRQKAAGVLGERDLVLRLLCDSVSTFCVLFRHGLRLAGEAPHYGKREVVQAAAQKWNLPAEPFNTVLSLRDGTGKQKEINDPAALLNAYIEAIGIAVRAVDALAK